MWRLRNLLSFLADFLQQENNIAVCKETVLSYSFCLLTLKNFCFLSDAVSTSAYSSPAKSLGDPGITPLSPSHIVVRNVLLTYCMLTLLSPACLVGRNFFRKLSFPHIVIPFMLSIGMKFWSHWSWWQSSHSFHWGPGFAFFLFYSLSW